MGDFLLKEVPMLLVFEKHSFGFVSAIFQGCYSIKSLFPFPLCGYYHLTVYNLPYFHLQLVKWRETQLNVMAEYNLEIPKGWAFFNPIKNYLSGTRIHSRKVKHSNPLGYLQVRFSVFKMSCVYSQGIRKHGGYNKIENMAIML